MLNSKCFARWKELDSYLSFRDQTILQFGDSWNLLANIVLLNPGSAMPVKEKGIQNKYLEDKNLSFYVSGDGEYYEFNLDPLMKNLIKLYSSKYDGGVIKIYNLFNLKNQKSNKAIDEYKQYHEIELIHTKKEEIKYNDKPVIIATGDNVFSHEKLINELKKYISLAKEEQLFSLQKFQDKSYKIERAKLNEDLLIESYHPSFTFMYGNTTTI